jgi:Cu-Zn family superoxide dismutase
MSDCRQSASDNLIGDHAYNIEKLDEGWKKDHHHGLRTKPSWLESVFIAATREGGAMRQGLCLVLIAVVPLLYGCTDPSPETESAAVQPAASADESETANLFTLGQQAREAKDREDWESARDIYLEALVVAPGHPVTYERIAEVEVRLGQLDAAVDHLATMARLGGTTPQIDQPLFEPLIDHPGFVELAAQIHANGAPQQPAEIFVRFDDNRLSPEGLAWDSETGDLFTGSFLLHKIVRISADGIVSDLGDSANHDLGAVLGMWVDAPRRELWAAAGSTSMEEMTHTAELVRYNVDTGELVARYPAPKTDQVLLVNDVVVTPDGTAWLTESLVGGLYRVPPGGETLELFLELPQFGFANGIAASGDGRTIYVAHAEGLSAIDAKTGAIEPVVPQGDFTLVAADGLSWADGALILVQNQPSLNNRVVRIELDATGRRALELKPLSIGLPPGLDPYTSAVADGVVYVTASSPIGPEGALENAPPPAIVRLPL